MPPQTTNRLKLAALLAAGIIIVAGPAWMHWRRSDKGIAPAVAAASAPASNAVSATGRFEPMEPATHVGAPYIQGHPAIVARLAVAEGEPVHAGQLIAVLAGKPQLEAAVRQASARVQVEKARLQEAKAGPRSSDVAEQTAEIARWQSALATAQADYRRYATLRRTRDVSASDLDGKRNQMENARQMLAEAKARLAGLTELHAQDVQAAQSQLDVARAELDRARMDMASADVRAPVDGVILHVRARPGEEIGPEGIVELAGTAQMDVLAEVYETDIGRVKLGEHADVVSELLPAGTRLAGTVVEIGDEVGRAQMVADDTAAFADARVVLVRIRLADSTPAAKLIHGKVSVILHP